MTAISISYKVIAYYYHLLRRRKHSASSKNIFTARGTNRANNTCRIQHLLKLLHPIQRRTFQGDAGNRVKTNQIDPARNPLQQINQSLCMAHIIIQIFENNILERDTPLMCEIILPISGRLFPPASKVVFPPGKESAG